MNLAAIAERFKPKKSHKKNLVGIDISARGIAMANVHWDEEGGAHLKSCSFSENIPEAEIKNHILDLVEKYNLTDKPCSIVLHAPLYQLLLVEVPDVQDNEIKDAVRWKIKDLISYPLEDAVIDTFLLPKDAYRGRMRMAYVVSIHKEEINRIVNIVKKTGLVLKYIDVSEMALRNVLLSCGEGDASRGIVYFHEQGGIINLCKEGDLYLCRHIDMGMHGMEMGDEDPPINGYAADGFAIELQRSLDFYEGQLGKGEVSELYVVPLHHGTDDFYSHVKDKLSAKVEEIKYQNFINCETEIDSEMQINCMNAVGAAMRVDIV